MTKFKIPGLCHALANFGAQINNNKPLVISGCQTVLAATTLPFDKIQIWTKLQLQNHSYYTLHDVLPLQTINILPPSDFWPVGWCDPVLVNSNPSKVWPASGFEGNGNHLDNNNMSLIGCRTLYCAITYDLLCASWQRKGISLSIHDIILCLCTAF